MRKYDGKQYGYWIITLTDQAIPLFGSDCKTKNQLVWLKMTLLQFKQRIKHTEEMKNKKGIKKKGQATLKTFV